MEKANLRREEGKTVCDRSLDSRIPGYSGLKGNKRAYKSANKAGMGERVWTAQQTSLTHIKRQITNEKKAQICICHEQKTKERESNRRAIISHV